MVAPPRPSVTLAHLVHQRTHYLNEIKKSEALGAIAAAEKEKKKKNLQQKPNTDNLATFKYGWTPIFSQSHIQWE